MLFKMWNKYEKAITKKKYNIAIMLCYDNFPKMHETLWVLSVPKRRDFFYYFPFVLLFISTIAYPTRVCHPSVFICHR